VKVSGEGLRRGGKSCLEMGGQVYLVKEVHLDPHHDPLRDDVLDQQRDGPLQHDEPHVALCGRRRLTVRNLEARA
jgi:hypothetical protein